MKTMERIKVLIADDNAGTRALIRDCFSKDDRIWMVGEAEDGLEACEMIRTLQPDVLLLDLVMPKRGGMYVLEQLRDISNPLVCPHVIVVSAIGSEEIIAEAVEKGTEYYVLKPFSVERLLGYVKNTVASDNYCTLKYRMFKEQSDEKF